MYCATKFNINTSFLYSDKDRLTNQQDYKYSKHFTHGLVEEWKKRGKEKGGNILVNEPLHGYAYKIN